MCFCFSGTNSSVQSRVIAATIKEEEQVDPHSVHVKQEVMVNADTPPIGGEVVIVPNQRTTTTTTIGGQESFTNGGRPGGGGAAAAAESQWHSTAVKVEDDMIKAESEADNLMCDDGNMYYGRLTYRDHSLLIQELCIDIGRNSSKSIVHFHVSKNNFISRKHMQIRFHPDSDSFHLECLSKNGIFVDGMFQRANMEPMELPKT